MREEKARERREKNSGYKIARRKHTQRRRLRNEEKEENARERESEVDNR